MRYAVLLFVALCGAVDALRAGHLAMPLRAASSTRSPVVPVMSDGPFAELEKLPSVTLACTAGGVGLMVVAPVVTSTGSPPIGLAIATVALAILKYGADQMDAADGTS